MSYEEELDKITKQIKLYEKLHHNYKNDTKWQIAKIKQDYYKKKIEDKEEIERSLKV